MELYIVSFYRVWLPSCTLMFVEFISVVVCGNSLFILIDYFMNMPQLIWGGIDGFHIFIPSKTLFSL